MCFYRYFFTGIALLFSGFVPITSLNAQSSLPAYVAPLPDGERLVDVAMLPEGRMVVASMRSKRMDPGDQFPWKQELQGVLRLLNEKGEVLAEREPGGSGKTVIRGVAAMPDGRVVVTGWTQSPDFTVVSPLFPSIHVPSSNGDLSRGQGFITIYSKDLSVVLRATLLGDPNTEFRFGTDPSLIAVDASSRIYIAGATDAIAGATDAADLPVAPGNRNLARGSNWPSMEGRRGGTFLLVFDGDLSEYLFSAMLGWTHSGCQGGSGCAHVDHRSLPLAMKVGANGRVILLAENAALPVTPGSLTVNEYAANGQPSRYRHLSLAAFDMQNAALLWSADLGRPRYPRTGIPRLDMDAQGTIAMALEAGLREPLGSPERHSIDILRISSDGGSLLQRDVLAEGLDATLDGFQLDVDGKYWLSGSAGAAQWEPIPAETRAGSQYLLRFNPVSRVLERYLLLPHGNATFLKQDSGSNGLWLAGRTGGLQQILRSTPSDGILGIANGAGLETSGRISPGEIVSLYGVGFGPDAGQGAVFDSSGKLPQQLNGVEVLLNGTPCSLLYASGVQINLIAPFDAGVFDAPSGTLLVEVKHQGVVRALARVAAAQTQPHVFHVLREWKPNPVTTETGAFPILQVYGREASGLPGSAIKPGDVLTLWMNGAGVWRDASQAGARAEAPLDAPRLRLRAFLGIGCGASGSQELSVEYFGAAPGFAAGLVQANLRVPADFAVPYAVVGCLSLTVGEDGPGGYRPIADAPLLRVQLDR